MACNKPPAVNPWRDDSIPVESATTPSEQGILAAGREPAVRHRNIVPSTAPAADWNVPHYPLWWEDPFEDLGDMNNEFAWTWQDYFAGGYSLARAMLNTVAFPVSAVCTPPCTPMISDGIVPPDRWHDAQKGLSADPMGDRSDFNYGGGTAFEMATPPAEEAVPPPSSAPAS